MTLWTIPPAKLMFVLILSPSSRTSPSAVKSVPGYTINGTSPGPTITAREGQLVEVHLRNASVKAGIDIALARSMTCRRLWTVWPA